MNNCPTPDVLQDWINKRAIYRNLYTQAIEEEKKANLAKKNFQNLVNNLNTLDPGGNLSEAQANLATANTNLIIDKGYYDNLSGNLGGGLLVNLVSDVNESANAFQSLSTAAAERLEYYTNLEKICHQHVQESYTNWSYYNSAIGGCDISS